MATGMFKSAETLIWACDALRAKFLCADKYTPQHKFNGNCTLIRAEQGAAREEDVGRDYGLSESVTGRCDVHVVEGDHDTFVQGDTHLKTSQILQEIVNAKSK